MVLQGALRTGIPGGADEPRRPLARSTASACGKDFSAPGARHEGLCGPRRVSLGLSDEGTDRRKNMLRFVAAKLVPALLESLEHHETSGQAGRDLFTEREGSDRITGSRVCRPGGEVREECPGAPTRS